MHTEYTKELSKCVQCGSCKAYCPTYSEELTEAMSARGRIALLRGLQDGRLAQTPALNERIFSCILCGACEKLCPPKVDITGAIYKGRGLLRSLDRKRRYLRMLMRLYFKKPALSFRIARILYSMLSPYLVKTGKIPFNISLPAAMLSEGRQVYMPAGKKKGRVAIFVGCAVNTLLPHLGHSLIDVLLHLGYEVVLPRGEVCCGEPLRGLGLEEEAVRLAEKNHEIFSKLNTDAILSLCPTCIVSLKLHYPKLLGRSLDNVMDISTFLSDKLEAGPEPYRSNFTTVTYHDPCHLKYSLGIREEPRKLIKLAGVELLEAAEEGCCGFGGVFSVQYKDISGKLLKNRVEAYTGTGADAIITSCPGCMLQIDSGLKGGQTYHLIELIADALLNRQNIE